MVKKYISYFSEFAKYIRYTNFVKLTFLLPTADFKFLCYSFFLPESDYITFGSLLSQFRLSSVCDVSAPSSGGWTLRQYFFTGV